jgi:hypothetical protein
VVTGHEEVQARERNLSRSIQLVHCVENPQSVCTTDAVATDTLPSNQSEHGMLGVLLCRSSRPRSTRRTMLTANLRKSAFNWPGNRRQQVAPESPALTR